MINVFDIVKDEFNSENFRILMRNIIVHQDLTEYDYLERLEYLSGLIEKSKNIGYKHLTLRVPTSDIQLSKCAASTGMYIVDTLVRYTFEFKKSTLPKLNYKYNFGDCRCEDLKTLMDISSSVFKIDRFHSDDYLHNDLCNQYYARWIENSFNGLADKIVVAYINDEPVGFATIKNLYNDDYVQIVLNAVSDKYKGLGIYTSMIHYCTTWISHKYSNEKKGIIIGTQIDNIAVQKTWIKLGYTIKDSQYIFHKVI